MGAGQKYYKAAEQGQQVPLPDKFLSILDTDTKSLLVFILLIQSVNDLHQGMLSEYN